MKRIRYQLVPDWLETDDFIQVEGPHLPRVGDTIDLDLHYSKGKYRVTEINYAVYPSDNSQNKVRDFRKQKRLEGKLLYQATDIPFVYIERTKENK